MTPLTPEQFAEKMRELFPRPGGMPHYDTDAAHAQADRLLCQVLRSLGYGDGVTIFEDADKWYA
jgi:hypothetical protein